MVEKMKLCQNGPDLLWPKWTDIVRCPTVGNKQWVFSPRLAHVVNQFAHFTHLVSLEILSRQTLIVYDEQGRA